jgi:BlaI family penicillinase repressor
MGRGVTGGPLAGLTHHRFPDLPQTALVVGGQLAPGQDAGRTRALLHVYRTAAGMRVRRVRPQRRRRALAIAKILARATFLAVTKPGLSRREREIMDILYRRGPATAAEVRARLPSAPSYSATRALLRILEDKGHVTHTQDKLRYVFSPTVPRERARGSALKELVQTFFDGSTELAIAALLNRSDRRLKPEEIRRIEQLIAKAKKEGR